MSSPTTSTLVRSGGALLLGFMCITAGCGSTDVLLVPGQAPIALPSRVGNYENPDNYRVDSSTYPNYVAKYNFSPPLPREGAWTAKAANAKILTTDIWHVTHKVGDRLLIFSETYQERQCNFLLSQGRFLGAFKSPLGGGCDADYHYELYLSPEGKVTAWMLLDNPKKVVLSKDRYTIMNPASREGPGWPEQPLFEAIH